MSDNGRSDDADDGSDDAEAELRDLRSREAELLQRLRAAQTERDVAINGASRTESLRERDRAGFSTEAAQRENELQDLRAEVKARTKELIELETRYEQLTKSHADAHAARSAAHEAVARAQADHASTRAELSELKALQEAHAKTPWHVGEHLMRTVKEKGTPEGTSARLEGLKGWKAESTGAAIARFRDREVAWNIFAEPSPELSPDRAR